LLCIYAHDPPPNFNSDDPHVSPKTRPAMR
jgi:hypothetical protein